jgi:hypothetical protein
MWISDWMDDWIEDPTKYNSKNPKKLMFNLRSMSKIQKSWIFGFFVGFLLDYWIGMDFFSIQSNNPTKSKNPTFLDF